MLCNMCKCVYKYKGYGLNGKSYYYYNLNDYTVNYNTEEQKIYLLLYSFMYICI